jgi:integrase
MNRHAGGRPAVSLGTEPQAKGRGLDRGRNRCRQIGSQIGALFFAGVILAEAIDPRYEGIVYSGAYLGLRWAELGRLLRKNLDLLRYGAKVVGSLKRFRGGNRYVDDTKSTASRREDRQGALELFPSLRRFLSDSADPLRSMPGCSPAGRATFGTEVPDSGSGGSHRQCNRSTFQGAGLPGSLWRIAIRRTRRTSSPARRPSEGQSGGDRDARRSQRALHIRAAQDQTLSTHRTPSSAGCRRAGDSPSELRTGRPDALVFMGRKGAPLRRAGFRRSYWQPATQKAELEGLKVHELRHTFVALWVAAGVNPKEVSIRAGHSSVAFTLDRYGHLYEDAGDDVPDRLDALLGARATPQRSPNR